MASGSDSERKEAYYLRLQLLVVKLGTAALKARFDKSIPPANLHTNLNKNIKTIQYGKNNNFISQQQYNVLFPQRAPPKSEDYDISLLSYLLRNVCGLNKKSQWWKETDNTKIKENDQSEEADIVRIRNMRNLLQHKHIASMEDHEFESFWNLMEKTLCRIAARCNMNDMQAKIDSLKESQLDLIPPQYKSLRVNSEYFLQDFLNGNQFVETTAYNKAKDVLENEGFVVLTGCPGEGKTTMAARLALSFSQSRNCVKLTEPSDWRFIDLNLKVVDTVIIDDIFGAGALDQRLVGEWSRFLPEIERAAKKKSIRVIITSRHYILTESLEEIGSSSISMFKEKKILLSSADLTEDEKSRILKFQSIKKDKEIPDRIVRECVEASRGPTDENPDFLFGFPECAAMFVRSDVIFNQGAIFFKTPSSHFKSYLEDMYRGKEKDKFLALVAVWAKENKRLSLEELARSDTVSEHVKKVANVFDRRVDSQFLDTLRMALESHDGDYLVFDKRTEEFTFSHNVIGDMVGLVIGKKKLRETIEICPRDFLMEYVSINESVSDDFKLVVKEKEFTFFAEKCTNMLLRRNCNSIAENPPIDEFQSLRRAGIRSNDLKIQSTIDYGIIKHKAFGSQIFVQYFANYVVQNNLVRDVFHVPVMKMTGYFFDYGISMKELEMCLLGYAWYSGSTTLAKEIITDKVLGDESFDPSISLLLATHSGQEDSIEFLLHHGAKVTGDAIYIAMHRKQITILEKLLLHTGTNVNDRGNVVHGNYPLIVAARKGMLSAVQCLLKHGADPGVRNNFGLTALHKAILYKHRAVTSALINAKAPLDVKGGKFKRTPLHLAADFGFLDVARELVQNGATLKVKDHRGHYPIHIAAIRGHIEVVRILFAADRTQDKWRISSHGTKSMIKGMSLYHIAVWKKNCNLMDLLIEQRADPNVQDFYGQTPLFYAVMKKEETSINKLLAYPEADKRKAQKQGFTPLHAAIHQGLSKVALSLALESDANARDKYGRTPLHVACEKSNLLVVYRLLTDFKADIRAVTKRDDTVYHIMRRKRTIDQDKNKTIENFLIDFDPGFAKQLPALKNKKGVAIRPRRTPVSRAQLGTLIENLTRWIIRR